MKRLLFCLIFALPLILSGCTQRAAEKRYAKLNQPVTASYSSAGVKYDGRVQVMAYNIEEGLYWRDALRYLKEQLAEMPATIMLLSECDRMHSRSGDVFVADELARALGLNMVFVTEYIEYNDQTKDSPGSHGNTILSPFPITDVTVIRHADVWSWTDFGWLYRQPRFGGRVTLGATVLLPDGKKLRVYESHLESNGETVGKWVQLSEVVRDMEKTDLPAVIGGDFNELPFGLMFTMLPRHGIDNAFANDNTPTGGCKASGDKITCSVKIDWIVYRGLGLISRTVDYPMNAGGGKISDHAPVRAVFEVKK